MNPLEGLVTPDWTPEMVEAVASQLDRLAKQLREGKVAMRSVAQERGFNRFYEGGGDEVRYEPTGRQTLKIEYDILDQVEIK